MFKLKYIKPFHCKICDMHGTLTKFLTGDDIYACPSCYTLYSISKRIKPSESGNPD